jgi:hypothetical protein
MLTSIELKPGKRWHFGIVGLYWLSFFLPVEVNDRGQLYGFHLFFLGLFCCWVIPAGVLESFHDIGRPGSFDPHSENVRFVLAVSAWLANPVFWIGLGCWLNGRWRAAGIAGVVAFLLGSGFYLFGDVFPGRIGVAYYVWLSSMGVLAAAGWNFHAKGWQAKRDVLARLAEPYPARRTEIAQAGPEDNEDSPHIFHRSGDPGPDGIVPHEPL